jgi:hypothetical protein
MNPLQDFTISNAELPKAEKRGRKKAEATAEVKEKKPRSRKSAVKEIVGELPAPAKELNGEVVKLEKRGRKAGPKVVASGSFEAHQPPATGSIGMDRLHSIVKALAEKHKALEDSHKEHQKHSLKMNDVDSYKWIQNAVKMMEKKGTVGAFTKQAKSKKESPVEYAEEVLEHPEKHIKRTRKRAQFVENVKPDAEKAVEKAVEKKPGAKRGGSAEHMAKMREARLKKLAEKKK